MRKNILLGLLALAVVGLIFVGYSTADNSDREVMDGKPGLHRGFGMMDRGMMMGGGIDHPGLIEDLGLSENATPEEVSETVWQKKLSDLGLTEDSTVRELREAMKSKTQEKHQEMLEKLGLDEDATPEDIRETQKAYCEENPDDCLGMNQRRQENMEEGLPTIKEKLGLSEDATMEEVIEALKERGGELGCGHGRPGFRRPEIVGDVAE